MPGSRVEASIVDVWARTFGPRDGTEADVAILDDDERFQASAFSSEPARRSYVASHAFLRRVLGHHLRVEPDGLRFDRTCDHCGHPRHGRPRLAGGEASFSLSHSGPHVLVAVGAGPIGADLESAARRPVAAGVVRRCCTAAERSWLAGLPAGDQPAAFLRLWTRKEAVAKALGLGLVLPFSSFEVTGSHPIVARDGAPPLTVHDVTVIDTVAAVATSPEAVIRPRVRTSTR